MKTQEFPFQPFSDVIAGYIVSPLESENKSFTLQMTGNKKVQMICTDTTYAEVMHNLDEPFQPATVEESIILDRFLFAYGVFYPEEGGLTFEVKHFILVGSTLDYRFEEPDWWIKQIRSLAEFYFHAQFDDGEIDYHRYRTHLTLEGQKIPSNRQETDTISRMVYGFATTYLLTGEERYLKAAVAGTEYLREHMRAIDENENIVYWYHAMDVSEDGRERKILSSQFGDDYEAIPAYEQIYALCGPTQTYRVTGDPRILRDVEMTINLFNQFFRDPEQGGYFSHIDPITFSPRSDSLGADRARKNWNSVGDHAPAYLINLWIATGEPAYAEMLVSLASLIEQHFPDNDHSPLVQERFYRDWSSDVTWGWQQNRAVVGHNLKIAWNLMRIHHIRPQQSLKALAKKIANVMPTVGMDSQRGGWYDTIERLIKPGEKWHRFIWHDRKAWWQQEQAILAYLILAGSLRDEQYQQLARESASFYNTFFLDHDNGGVYFNVLANGFPYLLGNERLKGSHSMSGYHSFELCYLAAVYTNLLITKQPMDFYFKPQPGVLKENILRVAPDLLPPGSIRLASVWINDQIYNDFDPVAMTVKLPDREEELKVHVRIEPTGTLFDSQLEIIDEVAHLTLYGTLNEAAAPILRAHLDQIIASQPQHVVLHLTNLQTIANGSARALGFVVEKLSLDKEIYVEGANEDVQSSLQKAGVWEQLIAEAPLHLVQPNS